MPDIVIDLLERYKRVPGREDLLNEYVRRFAGKRVGEFAIAAPLPSQPEKVSAFTEEATRYEAPAESAPESARADVVSEPEPEPTVVMEGAPEEPRSETVAFEAVSEQAAPERTDTVSFEAVVAPDQSEERSDTVAFEAITSAPEPTNTNRKRKKKRR